MDFISNEINRITVQGWAQETRGYVPGPEPRLGGLQRRLGSLASPFHRDSHKQSQGHAACSLAFLAEVLTDISVFYWDFLYIHIYSLL